MLSRLFKNGDCTELALFLAAEFVVALILIAIGAK